MSLGHFLGLNTTFSMATHSTCLFIRYDSVGSGCVWSGLGNSYWFHQKKSDTCIRKFLVEILAV